MTPQQEALALIANVGAEWVDDECAWLQGDVWYANGEHYLVLTSWDELLAALRQGTDRCMALDCTVCRDARD